MKLSPFLFTYTFLGATTTPFFARSFSPTSFAVPSLLPRASSSSSSSVRRRATVPSEEVSGTAASGTAAAADGSHDNSIIRGREPDMQAYAAGYKTVFDEISFKSCQPVAGQTIPSDLVGSYYKAGPGMFSAGSLYPPKTALVKPKQRPVPDGQDLERMVRHPFEGDGGILGITFAGGEAKDEDGDNDNNHNKNGNAAVTVRYRFVRTMGLFRECKVGRKRYTGMEATRELGAESAGGLGNFDWQLPLFRHHLLPGLNKKRRNTCNTRPIYWGKRLMSLWEGGQPFKIDAVALSTDGKSLLGGAIRKDDVPFGSKMVYDSLKNRAIFYGIEQEPKESEITIYEFDDKFRLIGNDDNNKAGRYSVTVSGCAILNDMAATENFCIFVQPPLTASFQFGFNRDPTNLKLGDGPALLHLIPRLGSAKEQASLKIPVDSEYLIDGNLLFCNSYEDAETGDLVIDAVRPEKPPSGKDLPRYPWVDTLINYRAGAGKKGLWRYTVNLKSNSVSKERLVSSDVSFPTINPAVSTQRHKYIYYTFGALGEEVSPPQGIARYDVDSKSTTSWMPEAYQFCGEPKYAPRAGSDENSAEDDGYILSVMFDGKKEESELLVFEANQIAKGPITRILLGFAVPHGLFGVFTADPEAAWSEETISRRAKLADKMESRGSLWNEVKSDFSGLGLRLDDIDEYFPGLFD